MTNVFFFIFTCCTLSPYVLIREHGHSIFDREPLVDEQPGCEWVPRSCCSRPYSFTPSPIFHLPKKPEVAFLNSVVPASLPLPCSAVSDAFAEKVLDIHQFFPIPTTVRWCFIILPTLLFKVSFMHPFNLEAVFFQCYSPYQLYNTSFIPGPKVLKAYPPIFPRCAGLGPWDIGAFLVFCPPPPQ